MSQIQRSDLNVINQCEVCGKGSLISVINLGDHALCDDLRKIGDEIDVQKYPIEIIFCSVCKTAHQKFQIPKKILFPKNYHYRSSLTKDVINGMVELVGSCEKKIGNLNGKKVLDIGCNDGTLLTIFKEKGALTYGIEPTDAALDARLNEHIVMQNYFDLEVAINIVKKYGQMDLISFTNVFAHIENLQHVIDALNILMNDNTYLIIENHYLGSIIEKNQFDTFYHEHPRTYSYTSFKRIAESLRATLLHFEFPKRYGGNIRVFISRKINSFIKVEDDFEILKNEASFEFNLKQMSENILRWRSKKIKEIKDIVRINGRLRAKAFPGRAAILLELLGFTNNEISAVYEQPKSPKVGCYVPGTKIPILSDNNLDTKDSTPIINLAWHIHDEITKYLQQIGFTGKIVPLVSQSDFE